MTTTVADTTPHTDVWSLLSDTSTPEGREFMGEFNTLNTALGGSLGRLAEQPQDIQGRDDEIRLLHAILERPKTPIALLLGEAGVGKALADSTPIPIADERGYVPISQLKVGDKVYNRLGTPTTVTGVYPQGLKDAWEVTFDTGEKIICNDEHLWSGWQDSDFDYGKPMRTATLRELIGEEILRDGEQSPVHTWWVPPAHGVHRPPRDLPVDPYVAGVLLTARGCYSPAGVLLRQESTAGNVAARVGRCVRQFPHTVAFQIVDEDNHPVSVDDIDPTGILGDGSRVIDRIPEEYFLADVTARADLIRGVISAVGVKDPRTLECIVDVGGKKRLAHDIAHLASSCGWWAKVDRTIDIHTMGFRYGVRMYPTGQTQPVGVRRLRRVGSCPMTCIKVDDAEELFQAGYGHIVTHNTALVEQFAKDVNAGKLDSRVHNRYFVIALRLGTLASLGTSQLQTRLSTLLDDLKKLQDVAQRVLDDDRIKLVVFIDEVHMLVTIFGPGTKVGGDVMKDVLARSPIRVIAATTRREYDTTIAVDAPLRQRFKQIEMGEVPEDVVVKIAKNWWEKVAPDCPPPRESTIRAIIAANAAYRSDQAEPRKTLDILEDLVSYSRRTGTRAGKDIVDWIFKNRYSISLSFEVDPDAIYDEIESRVKGQPHALFTMKRLLRSMAFRLDPTTNRPMATALFTGPTGVGKALADDTIIPGPDVDRPIGDLSAGDRVFGWRGHSATVMGVYPQGKLPAFRVSFGDGTEIVCNDGHKFSYITSDMRHTPHPEERMATATLKKLMDSGLYEEGDSSRPKFFIPTNGPAAYPPARLSTHPYVVGAVLGDGTLGTRALILATTDDHTAHKVASFLPGTCFSVGSGDDSYRYFFRLDDTSHGGENVQRSDVFVDEAESMCSMGRTHCRIPEAYLRSSLDQRMHLIQGLCDTAGRPVRMDDGRYAVVMTLSSALLAEDVCRLIRSVGVWATSCPRGEGDDAEYTITIECGGDLMCRFFTTPKHAEMIEKARTEGGGHSQLRAWVPIASIEPLDDVCSMTCIEVDDPYHLYQAGYGFVVTHNTETVKSIANSMYPGENVIQFLNMPDYKTAAYEPAFRKKLGELVRHTPNSIVLLDELEKAAPEVLDSLLQILDEGIVNYEVTTREGLPQIDSTSLRNTVVIATTNAGANVFANDARMSQRESMGADVTMDVNEAEVDQLLQQLRTELITNYFKPELLGRFQRIVPYRALQSSDILAIAELNLDKLFAKINQRRGLEIIHADVQQWPKDTYDYVTWDVPLYITFIKTNATDSNAGGVRAVMREIDTMIKDSIVQAWYENPHSTRFSISVSKESSLYTPGAAPTAGGVNVRALN